MRARRWLSLIVVGAWMTWGGVATAQPGVPGPGGVAGPAQQLLPILLRGTGLTAEQQRQVRDLLAARQRRIAPINEQLRQAQEELVDKVVSQTKMEEADLAPHLQRITRLREQLLQENIHVVVEVRGLLTSAQITRAAQMKDRLRALDAEYRQLWQPRPR